MQAAAAGAGEAGAEGPPRKKKRTMDTADFYHFQQHEKKREQLLKLREQFEKDKERIARMRATRKFKPQGCERSRSKPRIPSSPPPALSSAALREGRRCPCSSRARGARCDPAPRRSSGRRVQHDVEHVSGEATATNGSTRSDTLSPLASPDDAAERVSAPQNDDVASGDRYTSHNHPVRRSAGVARGGRGVAGDLNIVINIIQVDLYGLRIPVPAPAPFGSTELCETNGARPPKGVWGGGCRACLAMTLHR